MKRFGSEVTIEQVRRRMVCSRCGDKRVTMDVIGSGPVKGEHGWLVYPEGE